MLARYAKVQPPLRGELHMARRHPLASSVINN